MESVCFISNNSGKKTIVPIKGRNTKKQEWIENQVKTLGYGNLREIVKLPEGEDINEWLSYHVVEFYTQLTTLFMTVDDFCTDETCPIMKAGPTVTYLWFDGKEYKTPTEVSAPTYIRLLFQWIANQLEDESIFPSTIGVPFPKNFKTTVKTIMKRLFRVYAHFYHHHFETFKALCALEHLNTSFKHFYFFIHQFDLIPNDQLEPLRDLINKIEAS